MNEVPATESATNSPRGVGWGSRLVVALYVRLPALLGVVVCGGVLSVAAVLEADPAGLGTHTQLGMAPCGFLSAYSLPCATCGMTTAFAHAADGRLLRAAAVQPAAAAGALACAVIFILSLHALITGVSLGPVFRYLVTPATVWIAIALVIASWLYTIAQTRGLLTLPPTLPW